MSPEHAACPGRDLRRAPVPAQNSPTANGVSLVFPAQLSEEAAERFRYWSNELLETSRYRVQGGYADRVAELLASSLELPDDWSVMPLRSGTDSLLRALYLAGVKPGDRVIVPDLAFHAVAASVLQLGAVPVFADVDALDWNLDPASVALHLGREARAVIAVDNYGTPADLKILASLTRAAGAKLILDACESLGTVYAAGPPACYADLIVTSFSFTKPIHAAGMGGALCGPREAIAAVKSVPELMCAHFQLPEINAAYLVAAWPDLPRNIARLRSIYDRYTELGAGLGFVGQRESGLSTRIHAPLLLPEGLGACERDYVITELGAAGIASRGYFPSQSVVFGFGGAPPVSASIADRVVCLPTGSSMDLFAVDRVCASLSQVARSAPWALHPPVSGCCQLLPHQQ